MRLTALFFLLATFFTTATLPAQQLNLENPIRFLALGDSYTIGQSVPADQRWPLQLRDSLLTRAYTVDAADIIATTGWTTTNLLNAIDGADLTEGNYNLVSLLIGVNNQYQGQDFALYEPQFTQLLDSCLAYVGGDPSRVFVLSIPDYAYTPFGENNPNASTISMEIDAYNSINESIAADYGVSYFNITPISRMGLDQPGLVAGDGLHPSGAQYTLWVEQILEQLDQQTTSTKKDPAKGGIPMLIYPNPATEEIRIMNPKDIFIDRFLIYNSSGLMVKNVEVSAISEHQIILDLPQGLYYLEALERGSTVAIETFVIGG